MYINKLVIIIISFVDNAICCYTTKPFPNGIYEKKNLCKFTNITRSSPFNISELNNVILPCFEQKVGFHGNEINTDPDDSDYGSGVGKQESALECQQMCQARDECKFFTYVADDKTCWLQTSDTGRISGSQYTSGKKYCNQLPDEEIRIDSPILSCFEENVGFYGKDINNDPDDIDYIYGLGRQNSAMACQALCQSRNECNFFTYIPESRACWLKSSDKHKFYYKKKTESWPSGFQRHISGKNSVNHG